MRCDSLECGYLSWFVLILGYLALVKTRAILPSMSPVPKSEKPRVIEYLYKDGYRDPNWDGLVTSEMLVAAIKATGVGLTARGVSSDSAAGY